MARPVGCTCEWEGLLDGPSGDRVTETRSRPDHECPVHGEVVLERPAERIQVVPVECNGWCDPGGVFHPDCPAHGSPGDRLP